jgi:hypothetical protein
MTDDTARSLAGSKRWQRRGFGVSLAVTPLLAFALLAAGCGGGSKDPAAAGAGRSATTAAPSAAAASGGLPSPPSQAQQQQELLQLAECMRSNGEPNFPDPSPSAGILGMVENSGVDPQSPAFQAAWKACKKYGPGGNLTPAQSAAENAEGVQESQCMRSHGVPNFPDPTTGPVGEQVINLRGTGIDPTSPTVQAASQACQKLFPGSK